MIREYRDSGRLALRTLATTSAGTKKAAQALVTFSVLAGVDVAGTGFTRPALTGQGLEEQAQELEAVEGL